MSQVMLADRAQISRSNLSRIENGRMEPCLRTLGSLAAALDLKIWELMKDVDRA